MAETPWQAVQRLAHTGATGELIVASDAIEIHVYLLDGRLAWGTSSTARNEFLRRLVEDHGISADALREVIEECRRSRGRLGETLIARGVATADQIRDALAAQIADALAAAHAHPGARCLFLPRRLDYAMELTFTLAELAPRLDAQVVVQRTNTRQTVVTSVLDGVPEALWVEAVDRGIVVGRAVRGEVRSTESVAGLQAMVSALELDALTLRSSANGAVVGQRMRGGSGQLWCGVAGGAKLGVTSAVLAAAADAMTIGPITDADDGQWRERADPGLALKPSVFASAVRTSDELCAGFALADDGALAGVWRGATGLDDHAGWARRLAPTLTTPIRDAFSRTLAPLLYEQVSARAAVGDVVYYGTRLPAQAVAVWLVMRNWASQGLGWALLQTVARQAGGEP